MEESYKDPDEIASRIFREVLFEDHPYKYDTLGVLEDIDKIDKEDLSETHNLNICKYKKKNRYN